MSTDEIAMRKALSIVDGGIHMWKSPLPSDGQYNSFQSIAESVVEAKSLGLIYDLHVERSSNPNTLLHITYLKVYSGLTPKGKRRLSDLSKVKSAVQEKIQPNQDIVILQPNFYGIGLNFKALWSRFRSKLPK